LAVGGRLGETLANCVNDFISIEVATIDHVVDGYFGEIVESQFDFIDFPCFDRGFRVA
jgi:hypothetical protein